MQLPHTVEDEEGGCGITAPTTEPSSNRNALIEGDFHASRELKCSLQELGGPNDEVAVVRGEHGGYAAKPDSSRIGRAKGEPITEVEHLQDRLNGMIPIGSLAENAQSEIHFGRCGELAGGKVHGGRPPDHGNGRISIPAGGDKWNTAGARAGLRSTVKN